MKNNLRSIRPFIGAKNYDESRRFFRAIGFEETVLFPNLCLFQTSNGLAFYLQDAYVKDWIDNTMVFVEVDSADEYFHILQDLNLESSFPSARLIPVRQQSWGRECFLHDPSGILWHFGSFTNQ